MIISLIIFSAVILGLAGLAFQIARRSTRATDGALVMARLVSMVDKVSAVPYDTVATLAGCDSTRSGQVWVRGCITVTPQSPRLSDVRIIASTSVPGGRPDTILMQRSRDRVPVPLR